MPSTGAQTKLDSDSQKEPEPSELSKREEIARLAYSYWEAAGYPSGSAEEDWLRAERELERVHADSETQGIRPDP